MATEDDDLRVCVRVIRLYISGITRLQTIDRCRQSFFSPCIVLATQSWVEPVFCQAAKRHFSSNRGFSPSRKVIGKKSRKLFDDEWRGRKGYAIRHRDEEVTCSLAPGVSCRCRPRGVANESGQAVERLLLSTSTSIVQVSRGWTARPLSIDVRWIFTATIVDWQAVRGMKIDTRAPAARQVGLVL